MSDLATIDRKDTAPPGDDPGSRASKVLTLFGTRPEAIKLAPVIAALEMHRAGPQVVNVSSSQHTDLLRPFVERFGIRIHRDLEVMTPDQTPNQVCARVLEGMDRVLEEERPEMILVQGDTTTALAGALAGFHRGIPVGHIEAGLRSHNLLSPFPEEMNRVLISRVATYHFAATSANRITLLSEGVAEANVFVTGNPIVDSLESILRETSQSARIKGLLQATDGLKRIALTTHRRESFGEVMAANMTRLRRFVEERDDLALIFPVHPNPRVREAAQSHLGSHPRILLIEPLDYFDFINLLANSWLIVSDSGGVQEEAPTLGKPLLVLRENTERAESIECGVARLVGGDPRELTRLLEAAYDDPSWVDSVKALTNPFGDGRAGERIASVIVNQLNPLMTLVN